MVCLMTLTNLVIFEPKVSFGEILSITVSVIVAALIFRRERSIDLRIAFHFESMFRNHRIPRWRQIPIIRNWAISPHHLFDTSFMTIFTNVGGVPITLNRISLTIGSTETPFQYDGAHKTGAIHETINPGQSISVVTSSWPSLPRQPSLFRRPKLRAHITGYKAITFSVPWRLQRFLFLPRTKRPRACS